MPAAMTPESVDGLGLAPSPPCTSNNDSTGQQSPPAGDSDATAETDQKTKKRIQNRVAQRTYRNRMKQRVQDLEQQLCEMRARQQQAQYAYPSEYAPVMNTDGSVCMPPPGGLAGVSSIWQPNPTTPRHPSMAGNEMWPAMGHDQRPSQDMMSFPAAFMPPGFSQQQPFNNASSMSPLNLPTSTIDQLPQSMPPPDMDAQPVSPMHKLDDKSMLFKMGVHGQIPQTDGPEEDNAAWAQSPYMMSPGSSRMGTIPPSSRGVSHSPWGSMATATDMSDDGIPGANNTIEERFEYVLDCARKVGFETFDCMAAQYYASNFDQSTSLAMDQRVSRNRHLPAMLADLRQNSNNWSVWERRGYQDETLKAAEEICAQECRDFRAGADPVTLATVQQKLPNIWALLTGLASGTPLQRQGERTALVYNSIKQLCVLGDSMTHPGETN